MIKFLTPNGIDKARGNQYESTLTYSETVCHYDKQTQVWRELRMVETRAKEYDLDLRFQENSPERDRSRN